jgi:hypothetical protein
MTILDELSHNFGLTSLMSKTRSLLISQFEKESGIVDRYHSNKLYFHEFIE